MMAPQPVGAVPPQEPAGAAGADAAPSAAGDAPPASDAQEAEPEAPPDPTDVAATMLGLGQVPRRTRPPPPPLPFSKALPQCNLCPQAPIPATYSPPQLSGELPPAVGLQAGYSLHASLHWPSSSPPPEPTPAGLRSEGGRPRRPAGTKARRAAV